VIRAEAVVGTLVKTAVVALVVVPLAALVVNEAQLTIFTRNVREIIRNQTVVVSDSCTGTVVAPRTVVTASHCVGGVGSQATVRLEDFEARARVVWHSSETRHDKRRTRIGLDLAVLSLAEPWPHFRSVVCFADRPSANHRHLSRSFSLQFEWWDTAPSLEAVLVDRELGEVAVWRGDYGPGVSGSLVYSTRSGCAVGIMTHIITAFRLSEGAVGWRLGEVVGRWLR